MTDRRKLGLLLLVVSFGVAPAAAQETACQPEVSNGGRTILLNWETAVSCLAKPNSKWDGRISGRVDEDMTVTIRSTHFNFIKYAIRYEIEETVVESYVLLARLWSGILGFDLGSLTKDVSTLKAESGNAIVDWASAVARAQAKLDAEVQAAPGEAFLTTIQIDAVGNSVKALAEVRSEVMTKYLAALQFNAFAEFEQYGKVKVFHDAVLGRLDAYVDLASLTASGQVKTIPKKNGGTIVTVTMTPATTAGADRAPVLAVEYFSHSRLPLTFHAGYARSGLDEFDFEEVAAFARSDLFARIKTNDNTQTFTAFMTYEPQAWVRDKVAGGVTIGTDVVKPGQRLFLGGSIRYGRFVFTYGGMSGELTDGVDPVIEPLGGGTRQLFGALVTRRDWAQFFAFSAKVF